MAYEKLDIASKTRLLRNENLAIDTVDITREVRDGISVCSYGSDGVFIARCPTWEGDLNVCCVAHAHFDNRVKIGELQMVSRYAKLLQDPKSAVGNPCASLPWDLVYGEEYVHSIKFLITTGLLYFGWP